MNCETNDTYAQGPSLQEPVLALEKPQQYVHMVRCLAKLPNERPFYFCRLEPELHGLKSLQCPSLPWPFYNKSVAINDCALGGKLISQPLRESCTIWTAA